MEGVVRTAIEPIRTLPPGVTERVLAKLFPPDNPYRTDPVAWGDEVLDSFWWSKQREIAEAVRDHRYVAVHSAHDTGKSYIASSIGAWWLDTRPVGDAFVVTTAPTWPQVKAILWRELRRRKREGKLRGRMNLQCEWYMGDNGEEELVAYGRKPADYDQAAFQGIHALYPLIIMDEACGIPKSLYDAVDSLATNENSRVLAIGNPDDPASHFERICRPGSGWHVIQVSAWDTPAFTGEEVPEELLDLLVSKQWVKEREKRWGRNSFLFISKVDGVFPPVGHDTLIQPGWIRAAQQRDLPGLDVGRYGADIARYGRDKTVVYRNRDGRVRKEFESEKQSTTQTKGRFISLVAGKRNEVPMVMDCIGIGAGIYDDMLEDDHNVYGFDAGGAAQDPARFINARAEAWWTVRELFEEGLIDLDEHDEDLAQQLGDIKWGYDTRGRIKIESKDEMKKRLGADASPDHGDAFMMSCVVPPVWDPATAEQMTDGVSLTGDLLTRPM